MMKSSAIELVGSLEGMKAPKKVNHQAEMAGVSLTCLNLALMLC